MREASKLAHVLRVLNRCVPLIGVLHGGLGGGVGMAASATSRLQRITQNWFDRNATWPHPSHHKPLCYCPCGGGEGASGLYVCADLFCPRSNGPEPHRAHLPKDDLEARVEAEVTPYLSVAPEAVAASKSLARLLGPRIDDQLIEETITRLCDTWEGDEAKEGIDAFLTKRKPRWA